MSAVTQMPLIASSSIARYSVVCLFLLAGVVHTGFAADEATPGAVWKGDPQIIDISPFCNIKVRLAKSDTGALAGRVFVDGVPFLVADLIRLYGQTSDERGDKKPEAVKGIPIGRRFDELQLIHYAGWPDAEGEAIAYICLNYSDDTESIIPVRYGVHLRDHLNLPSYELEAVSDPGTTICWRGPPTIYKAPARLFKSKLANPSPDKLVKTMDIVSARNLSNYCLCAATVINCDAKSKERPVGERTFAGDRKFDSKLVIRVVDDATGKPIAGALVIPGMQVVEEGVVGTPLYTSSAGEGAIPFPKADTKYLYASVKKEGYDVGSQTWEPPQSGTFTFRLLRTSSTGPGSSDSVAVRSAKTPAEPLIMMNADGSDSHRFAAMDDYTACGSPRWSRDDQTIVFDCWRSQAGNTNLQSHIFVINADGKSPRDLGDGTLPSLSPDGKRVVYSRYEPRGICIANVDGPEKESIDTQSIDPEGWGADWSPKKDELVYTKYTSAGPNLYVRDLKTNEMRPLLEKQYEMIYWGQSYSPDGNWICFKGTLPDGKVEMAVVHIGGQAHGFKVLVDRDTPHVKQVDNFFSWQPDSKHVIATMQTDEDVNGQLYLIDIDNPATRRKIAGQDPARRNYVPACSSDGRRILYASARGKPLLALKPALKSEKAAKP